MTRIALVVLDTLRRDAFEDHFDWLLGSHYPNAYSTANWTSSAHASLFTGFYPSETGVTAKSRTFDTERQGLPEVLRENGYRTVGYSANPNVSARNSFDRGFDEFTNPTQLRYPNNENRINLESYIGNSELEGVKLYLDVLRACIFGEYDTIASIKLGIGQRFDYRPWQGSVEDYGTCTVLEKLEEDDPDENQFTFINLMETHTPYDPPPEFNTANDSVGVVMESMVTGVDDPDRVRRGYDDAARYLSFVYESMFDVLAEDYDYVVTLSDHGEMLGEHGLWNHTFGLFPEITNVPLVITDCNDLDDGRAVVDDPVSIVDVHKTILDLAGLSRDSRGQNIVRSFEPVDRLVEFHGLIPYARRGLREAGIDDSEIDHYDRQFRGVVTDAGEYVVADEEHPSADVDCEARIEDVVADFRDFGAGGSTDGDGEVDGETLSQLENLGYV